jgi:hypothetical protein
MIKKTAKQFSLYLARIGIEKIGGEICALEIVRLNLKAKKITGKTAQRIRAKIKQIAESGKNGKDRFYYAN